MGWKIGGVLSAILAGLAALITLTTAAEYKTGIEWVITLIFVLLAVLCFWRAAKAGARKKAKRAAAQQVFCQCGKSFCLEWKIGLKHQPYFHHTFFLWYNRGEGGMLHGNLFVQRRIVRLGRPVLS